MKRFALTAIGRDTPGIVARVTKALFEHGFNIEDSSMTILQDEFAVILITSAPDEVDTSKVESDLKGAEAELKLTIHFKEIEPESPEKIPGSTHIVTVSGYDRPGIVYKTSEFLAKWGVNITDLSTRVLDGEEKPLYIMLLEVHFPDGLDPEAIEGSLKTLGDSMDVKIDVKAIDLGEPL